MEELQELRGKVIEDVEGLEKKSQEILFKFEDGSSLRMLHYQDCCECVAVNDICGDEGDLIGGTIVDFREDTRVAEEGETIDFGGTWTFYNISTTKGSVNIRWLGESNGYYSEFVDWEYRESSL